MLKFIQKPQIIVCGFCFFNYKITKINKQEAIDWFNDLENFKTYHDVKKAEHLALEMDFS